MNKFKNWIFTDKKCFINGGSGAPILKTITFLNNLKVNLKYRTQN